MTQTTEQPPATARRAPTTARKPRRQWPHRMIPVVLLLLGAVVLFYPVGATIYNNYKQTQFAQKYANDVNTADPVDLNKALARAARYNAHLPGDLLRDPWKPKDPKQRAAYKKYEAELNDFDAMARIRIPAIKVDLPIFHGTSDATLSRGVGHLFGSTLPIGGPDTHAVLTGHSSLPTSTMFDHLERVRLGDQFYVEVYGKTLAYQVDHIETVLPTKMDSLRRFKGKDYVTLITCTPYAINSHRLLVRGHQVPYVAASDPGAKDDGFHITNEKWMWPRLIGAALALALLAAMVVSWIRSDRRRKRRRLARLAAAEAGETHD